MTAPAWDAVVLAGGAARRMGGDDKLMLDVGGRSLLDRVLDALADATTVVCVGPVRPVRQRVVWCREDPPGGGPAAAVAAGLAHVTAEVVVVAAADLPFLDAASVHRLVAATSGGGDGAIAVDGDGRPQWACSAWRAERLRTAGLRHDGSLRAAMQPLRWTPVVLATAQTLDCDTPEDLETARELVR